MEECGPSGVFRAAFTTCAPGARSKPALPPPSGPWTVANVGPTESARAGRVRARGIDERRGRTEKCAATTDSCVVAAGDRADPPQRRRPTRMPVVLGGRHSPEARATRAPAALCRPSVAPPPGTRSGPPHGSGRRCRGSVDQAGLRRPGPRPAHPQSRSTREPQDSTLSGRHCHHRSQEQGADSAGTSALAPTHKGCGGHTTALPSPTAGCRLEGAVPQLLRGADQPDAMLGRLQAQGHTLPGDCRQRTHPPWASDSSSEAAQGLAAPRLEGLSTSGSPHGAPSSTWAQPRPPVGQTGHAHGH